MPYYILFMLIILIILISIGYTTIAKWNRDYKLNHELLDFRYGKNAEIYKQNLLSNGEKEADIKNVRDTAEATLVFTLLLTVPSAIVFMFIVYKIIYEILYGFT